MFRVLCVIGGRSISIVKSIFAGKLSTSWRVGPQRVRLCRQTHRRKAQNLGGFLRKRRRKRQDDGLSPPFGHPTEKNDGHSNLQRVIAQTCEFLRSKNEPIVEACVRFRAIYNRCNSRMRFGADARCCHGRPFVWHRRVSVSLDPI